MCIGCVSVLPRLQVLADSQLLQCCRACCCSGLPPHDWSHRLKQAKRVNLLVHSSEGIIMDIKQLARQRIAEAEAAIAAAGKSALSTYHAEGFRSDVANPVPWASAHEVGLTKPAQFPTSFAERLKLHEAHLNALKQASKKPPLPNNAMTPAAQPRTFSSLSDPSASYLPPWSQPHHMPTFRRTYQSGTSTCTRDLK